MFEWGREKKRKPDRQITGLECVVVIQKRSVAQDDRSEDIAERHWNFGAFDSAEPREREFKEKHIVNSLVETFYGS